MIEKPMVFPDRSDGPKKKLKKGIYIYTGSRKALRT